jgi:hypothetical protein
MQNIRKWMHTWLSAFAGAALTALFLAAVTVGHAAGPQDRGKALEQPAQGQQLCPATPGAAVCQVKSECPPIKAPGQTVCQAAVDCPEPQKPVKPKRKTTSP